MTDKLYDATDTIWALRAASKALWEGFYWGATPEGHDYWKAQATHLSRLAEQMERNLEAYLSD